MGLFENAKRQAIDNKEKSNRLSGGINTNRPVYLSELEDFVKQIIPSLSGGSSTASNGLYVDISDIKLGGLLIEDTTIDGGSNGTSFSFLYLAQFYISSNDININANFNITASSDSVNLYGSTYINLSIPDVSIRFENLQTISDGSSNNCIVIFDNNGNKGITYDDYYESNFTDLSLVTKLYVDTIINNQTLAQILFNNNSTGDLSIVSSDGYNSLLLNTNGAYLSYDNGSNVYPTIFVESDEVALRFNDDNLGLACAVNLTIDDVILKYYNDTLGASQILRAFADGLSLSATPDGIAFNKIEIFNNLTANILITDEIGETGAVYAADYSSNFIDESLVSKRYVDNLLVQKWIDGSTGYQSIKANNDSGLDATGDYSVAKGAGTIASGYISQAEGNQTQAIGDSSHAEGHLTRAEAKNSHVGGYGAKADHLGEWARSSNGSNVAGFGQYGIIDIMTSTSNATITEMFIGDVGGARITIGSGQAYRYTLTMIAQNSSTGEVKEWEAKGLIKNVGGTTSMVGSSNVSTYADASMATTSLGIAADNTNGSLLVEATGIAATNISWYGKMDYTRIN